MNALRRYAVQLWWIFLVLPWLPLIFVASSFYFHFASLDNLIEKLGYTRKLIENRSQKMAANRLVKTFYQGSDPLYLDKLSSNTSLLQKEISDLQKRAQSNEWPMSESMYKRLQFLKEGNNRLSFVEVSRKRFSGYQEVVEALSKPVEVDMSDVRKVLSQIEGIDLGEGLIKHKPQLIVLEFSLDKPKTSDLKTSYMMKLKLLSREYE